MFLRLYNWTNDAASNIKIRADRSDNELDGIATGLTTCITKNGQTTITANLPMAGFIHTGVGDAISRNQYASAGQVQDGKINWVAAGGTADAITAAYTIPVTALVDGEVFYLRAGAANVTTTPTFSPSGLTAHTIVKSGGQALAANDIFGAGHELVLRYNLANTRYELLNPAVVPAVNITGNAATATKLATARTLAITGDLAYTSPSFDGSANVTAAGTLATVNSNVGSFTNASITVNGKGLITAASSGAAGWTQLSPQNSTSGTSIDFSGIPSTAKVAKVTFKGVSTSGTNGPIMQLLVSGSPETTGYLGSDFVQIGAGVGGANATTGVQFNVSGGLTAARVMHGQLELVNQTGNDWIITGIIGMSDAAVANTFAFSKSLSGTLSGVRITTLAGTDTFDAGVMNVMYQ